MFLLFVGRSFHPLVISLRLHLQAVEMTVPSHIMGGPGSAITITWMVWGTCTPESYGCSHFTYKILEKHRSIAPFLK